MKLMIKRFIIHIFFLFPMILFAANVSAMVMSPENRARFQKEWQRQQPNIYTKEQLLQKKAEQKRQLLEDASQNAEQMRAAVKRAQEEAVQEEAQLVADRKKLRENPKLFYQEERERLFNDIEQRNLGKLGYFQRQVSLVEEMGANGYLENEIIFAAFDLLRPYKENQMYGSSFQKLRDHIKYGLCEAIKKYQSKGQVSYFFDYSGSSCSAVMKKIDNLINYNPSKKVEPTMGNRWWYPARQFETQELYEQFEKKMKK
jgi:hypothetical protein